MNYTKIVLNIPHSSISGIFGDGSGWAYDARLINSAMRETDWHTDFIFSSADNPNIVPCIFPFSRFLVDVERLDNDDLESEGRGIIYTDVDGCKRGNLSTLQKESLLLLRKNHLNRLSQELTKNSILVDCHSFNEEMANDVDICIGYNEDWSRPNKETIDGVKSIFQESGYRVEVNYPYGNSITPKADFEYKSLMIEVNKRTYLNIDNSINTAPTFAPRLIDSINKVYKFLLGV